MPLAVQLVWKVLVVLGLVVLNGFFVAAEFALVKVRETQLDMLVLRGHRRAKVARSIVAHLNSYLSATQLGITMASLGLGWAGEPVFLALLKPALAAMHVQSEAAQIAKQLAAGPTEAFGAIKRLFCQTADRPFESQLEEEAQTLAAISRTEDAREGVRAFVEKRKPVFVGK